MSLTTVSARMFSSIALYEIKATIFDLLPEEENGFRKCYSCNDDLLVLGEITKLCMV